MTSAHIVAAVIGIFLSFSIIFLVRKDHISPIVAARWFLISMMVLILSLMPSIVDKLGELLGIGYPPIIPVLLAISAALIKILMMDIERQKMQVKLDRMIQKVAILEGRLDKETKSKTRQASNIHLINSNVEKLK